MTSATSSSRRGLLLPAGPHRSTAVCGLARPITPISQAVLRRPTGRRPPWTARRRSWPGSDCRTKTATYCSTKTGIRQRPGFRSPPASVPYPPVKNPAPSQSPFATCGNGRRASAIRPRSHDIDFKQPRTSDERQLICRLSDGGWDRHGGNVNGGMFYNDPWGAGGRDVTERYPAAASRDLLAASRAAVRQVDQPPRRRGGGRRGQRVRARLVLRPGVGDGGGHE